MNHDPHTIGFYLIMYCHSLYYYNQLKCKVLALYYACMATWFSQLLYQNAF